LGDFNIKPYSSHGGIFLSCATKATRTKVGTIKVARAIDYDNTTANGRALSWGIIYTEDTALPAGDGSFCYLDQSAESGVPYRYRISFEFQDAGVTYFADTNISRWKKENPSATVSIQDAYLGNIDSPFGEVLLIDDLFLTSKTMTLKVRFDPVLTGLKYNHADAITPTLGGAYPFVRRNGQ
jgi:hypothetical protein